MTMVMNYVLENAFEGPVVVYFRVLSQTA